jgi:hypothetical protein
MCRTDEFNPEDREGSEFDFKTTKLAKNGSSKFRAIAFVNFVTALRGWFLFSRA